MGTSEKRSGISKVDKALASLSARLGERDYEQIEYVRMAKDLERVEGRLVNNEYFYTDFAGNTFNVPERTREYFMYFNSYFHAARTWAQVLGGFNVHQFSTVADLCPGWAPKIELALFYLQYAGKVRLLDKDEASLRQNELFIRLFNPKYSLETQVVDIFEVREPPGDLLLANHLIDDLLLTEAGPEAGFNPTEVYEREDSMREAWRAILSRRSYFFSRILDEFTALFLGMIEKGGCLILTQYEAYVEKLLGLKEASAFCREIAVALVERLKDRGCCVDEDLVKRCLTGFGGWFGPDECFVVTGKA